MQTSRTASYLSVIVSLIGYGFVYSLGKIDHTILLVVVPAAMAPAGWGDRFSLDAVRRRSRGHSDAAEPAEQWALRWYALAVGLAFLTGAIPKLRGGWLDPTTHAVQAIQARQLHTHGHTDLLARTALDVDNPVLWELADVLTLVLEAGMVLTVLSWAGTRLAFAVAAVFHLGVWLTMNITFYMNVVAYGIVVAWDRIPVPDALRNHRAPHILARFAPLVVVGGGLGWAAVVDRFGNAAGVVHPVLLIVAALVGSGYLARLALGLARHRRPRETPTSSGR